MSEKDGNKQDEDKSEEGQSEQDSRSNVRKKLKSLGFKKQKNSAKKKKSNWSLKFGCGGNTSSASSTSSSGSHLDVPGASSSPAALDSPGPSNSFIPYHCFSIPIQGDGPPEMAFNMNDLPSDDEMAESSSFHKNNLPPSRAAHVSNFSALLRQKIANNLGPYPYMKKRANGSNGYLRDYIPHSTKSIAHTQVDYVHYLVPDLHDIFRCSFYWGKMDRFEAEKLLDKKPEGTFLLRDSAQEEYLFSVSFRRYDRTLHARVEQLQHMFSFDPLDPSVFSSPTVVGLIEHYKDPNCCMFFEPMLIKPLHRTQPFSLQNLCRAAICSKTTYDGINELEIAKSLKAYLREYHYKHKVRVRILDS